MRLWVAAVLGPLRYVARSAMPQPGGYWDGVAWVSRMILIGVHLAFALPTFLRPNTPLLLQSYSAFDDHVAFTTWGLGGLMAAVLLLLLPPRVPWGMLSTGYSAFYLYLIGNIFGQGAGLVSAVLLYDGLGLLSGLLLMRAMWTWAEPQAWFQTHVIRKAGRGR